MTWNWTRERKVEMGPHPALSSSRGTFQVPGCRKEGKRSILDGWEMETVRRNCEAASVRLGV